MREIIDECVSKSALRKRNARAAKKPIHYRVYWKNENAFQKEYTQVFEALTERDAREYVDYELLDEFTFFKITKIDRNTETEVAVIRNKHIPSGPEYEAF